MLNKSDLSQIRKTVQEALGEHPTKADLAKELKPIKSDVAKIRKDIDAIISLFDREYVDLRKRVARIEEHLGLSPS